MDQAIDRHYGTPKLLETLDAALAAAGKDLDRLTIEDLSPVDQFHLRGREATLEVKALAGIRATDRVLDVGGGLGGAARLLAADPGCHVTVVDLTEEYCRIGEVLTRRVGLDRLVTFRHASALALPFEAASFDVAWTQHSSMNIEDKEGLYRELARAVRPGGKLVLYEVFAGEEAPIHFPVPWAPDASISFLRRPEEMRAIIRGAGFQEVAWKDLTAVSLAWIQERIASGPAPLGLHLLIGKDTPAIFRNVARNFSEQRLTAFAGVFAR